MNLESDTQDVPANKIKEQRDKEQEKKNERNSDSPETRIRSRWEEWGIASLEGT